MIPYIGDLVGNIPLHDLDLSEAAATAQALFTDLAGPDLKPPGAIRLRADVAKTIYYRRRKGTPPMLEELARDVTGWGAHVRRVLHPARLEPAPRAPAPRLRKAAPTCAASTSAIASGGPWDTTTHTVDVRRINEWDGWYNIPNIGFFLWRLEALGLTRVTPRSIGGTPWRLTFSPLGQDIPLFSRGHREPGDWHLATELTVAAPIRGAAFFEDLRRLAPPAVPPLHSAYYGGLADSSLVVFDGANPVPDDRHRLHQPRELGRARAAGRHARADRRDARPPGRAERPRRAAFTVSYFHGLGMRTGGGEYPRAQWLVPAAPGAALPVVVSGGGLALANALAAPRATQHTIFRIDDSATYLLNASLALAPARR